MIAFVMFIGLLCYFQGLRRFCGTLLVVVFVIWFAVAFMDGWNQAAAECSEYSRGWQEGC